MDQILKQQMDNLKTDVEEMSSKIDDLHNALMGNKLVQDGGLIGRIIELEKDNELLTTRVEILEKEKSKSDIYIRIMWGLGGMAATGCIGYILSLIFKK